MRASVLILASLVVVGGLGALAVAGRSAIAPAQRRAKMRHEPASVAKPAPPRPSEAVAVTNNASLSRTVEWQFGGKTQRGWHLYVPLIQRVVGTAAEPDSEEFTRAVTDWQRRNGHSPADGALDESCWVAMMQSLQRARTRDATLCPAEELVQISADQWYDPERPAELRYLRRDAYEAYLRMVAAARAELGSAAQGYFSIISGHRTPEYQAKLRALAGNPSTASLARNSPHFTGRAIDIYVGGEPVSTADPNRAIQVATPAYRWLAANAHRFGFRPYFYEPWHWEYDPRLENGAAE
jgi:hypothetical protein